VEIPESPQPASFSVSHHVIAEIRTTDDQEIIATVRIGDEAQPIVLDVRPDFTNPQFGEHRNRPWRQTVKRLISLINTRVRNAGSFENFDGKTILIKDPRDLCIIQEIDALVRKISAGMAKVCILENTSQPAQEG